jgi:hypothetical protein
MVALNSFGVIFSENCMKVSLIQDNCVYYQVALVFFKVSWNLLKFAVHAPTI